MERKKTWSDAERVHPDAIAEQRSPTAPASGVDSEHGDAQLVLLIEPEPEHELVGERRLPGAAGASDAQHRDTTPPGERAHLRAEFSGEPAALDGGDEPGEGAVGAAGDLVERVKRRVGGIEVARGDHRVDHPGEAHPLAVLGREDPRHAIGVELGDLDGGDDAPASAVDLHVTTADFAEPIDQIAEVLRMPTLVRRDGDSLHVFLDHCGHDLLDRAVVTEVDHLGTLRLEQAPHDVDRGIVAVEEAGRSHEPDRVHRSVERHLPHSSWTSNDRIVGSPMNRGTPNTATPASYTPEQHGRHPQPSLRPDRCCA